MGLESKRNVSRAQVGWILALGLTLILIFGFATYDPARWPTFFLIGVLCFAVLAVLPPLKRTCEAWICLAIIVACGVFGLWEFMAEVNTIVIRDRFEILRLYVGLGIVAGIGLVIPYVLIRLVVLWASSETIRGKTERRE
jgi:hypothetical protein